jgi:hypothetical protein
MDRKAAADLARQQATESIIGGVGDVTNAGVSFMATPQRAGADSIYGALKGLPIE